MMDGTSSPVVSPSLAGGAEVLRCLLEAGARFKVIGLGGVGGCLLPFLALFLHGLQRPFRLVLVDGDSYDAANASRMFFPAMGNKAEVKAEELLGILGPTELAIVPVPEYVTAENAERILCDGDIIFSCVDLHSVRRLISERCERLSDVALFSGGNEGVDPPRERGTGGNVQIHIRRGGKDLTAPITSFHPEIANAVGGGPVLPGCGEIVKSVPQILFANLGVAYAMLSAFFAYACGRLGYQEVHFDVLEGRMLPQLMLSRGEFVGRTSSTGG